MSDTPTINVPISELPEASGANEYDIFPGVQNGETKKFSLAIILSWLRQRLHFSSDSSIATVENTSTASHVHLAGMRFMREGILYEATTQINVGYTISPGVNCEAVMVENVKQNTLTFDNSPTEDSNNPVKSGGIYTALGDKQEKIAASGILKGDGAGGVSAATPGTDYGTYSKPSGGIPSTDMTSAVQTSLGKADTAYQKPSSGIPSSDMASGVQTSLGKADTAYQKPSGGIPASDLANGVIPTVPSAYTSNPAMDGTASPGSSGAWARGDHVHPTDTSKANETELAYVETGSTASRAYVIGDYFCWGGTLYKAKTAISSGDSFTVGTNCDAVTGGGMNEIITRIMPLTKLGTWFAGSSMLTMPRGHGPRIIIFASADSRLNSFLIAQCALDGTVQYSAVFKGSGIFFSTGVGTLTASIQYSGNGVTVSEQPLQYYHYSTFSTQ